jgi:quercetin dioxygenase-like cupin family protein
MLTEGSVDTPVLVFDLAGLLVDLKREATWDASGHNAMTLAKTGGLRVVLVALQAGATLPAHRAHGVLAVHVLGGRILFRTEAGEVPLHAGQLLTLQRGVVHRVQAEEEASFVLTMAAGD